MLHISEKTPNSQWWRWPLIPIAALIGAPLGGAVIAILQWLSMKMMGGFYEDGWWYRYVMPVSSSAVSGYLYTHITWSVAPNGKVIASVVMITLLSVIAIFNVLLAWAIPRYSLGDSIRATLGSIAAVMCSIVTLVDLYREEQRKAAPKA